MAETSKHEVRAVRIAAWRSSGMSRRAWCRVQGVNVNTLDYWCRRLRQEPIPASRPQPRLLQIMVAPGAAQPMR